MTRKSVALLIASSSSAVFPTPGSPFRTRMPPCPARAVEQPSEDLALPFASEQLTAWQSKERPVRTHPIQEDASRRVVKRFSSPAMRSAWGRRRGRHRGPHRRTAWAFRQPGLRRWRSRRPGHTPKDRIAGAVSIEAIEIEAHVPGVPAQVIASKPSRAARATACWPRSRPVATETSRDGKP